MSLSSRTDAVQHLLEQVRRIHAKGIDRAALQQLAKHLGELAERHDLFNFEAFPPPHAGNGQTATRYRLNDDGEDSPTLYLNSLLPGKNTVPHNHDTWAVIVAVEGQELNKIYRRLDDGSNPEFARLELDHEFVVQPGSPIGFLGHDIHSILVEGEQPTLHFHLYGKPLESLVGRIGIDLESGRVLNYNRTQMAPFDIRQRLTQMTMSWLLRRLLLAVAVLLLVSLLIFGITQVLPGDAAQAVLSDSSSPERIAQLRQQMGLDTPATTRYLNWIGALLQGDPGHSLISGQPISTLLQGRLHNSLLLVGLAALTSIPLALLLGTLSALWPRGWIDNLWNSLSVSLAAIPDFVIGIMLVALLSTSVFHLLPAVAVVTPGASPLDNPAALVLPLLTLTLGIIPFLSRLVRASLIEALASEYVSHARLKGMPASVLLFRHAIRNCVVPLIQGITSTLLFAFGGVVLIEYLFQYPGLGSALLSAIGQRDIPLIQAIALIFASTGVLLNLLCDLLVVAMTPRLRGSLA